MSTIKSSSEDLTLNADGAGNDIKFQSNGVEKASLTDAGVFTATSIRGIQDGQEYFWGMFHIINSGGTMSHKWTDLNAGGTTSMASNVFVSTTITTTATPAVSSVVDFANGAGLAGSQPVLDNKVDQNKSYATMCCEVGYNNTGTAVQGQAYMSSTNVNGETWNRHKFNIYADDGSATLFAVNTTNITSGKIIRFIITGYGAIS